MSLHPLREAAPAKGLGKLAAQAHDGINRASRRIAARVFEQQVKTLRKAELIGAAVIAWLLASFRKLTKWLGTDAKKYTANVAGLLAGQYWATVQTQSVKLLAGGLGQVAEKAHNDALATVVTELKPVADKIVPLFPTLKLPPVPTTPAVPDTAKQFATVRIPQPVPATVTHKTAFDYLNAESRRPDTTPQGMTEPHATRKRIDRLTVLPLSAKEKERLVFASGWQKRITEQTGLGSPAHVAAVVSKGLRENKTVKEIARDLLPAVNANRATANRIARHETMHMAHRANMAAWGKLGTLVIGYTVHSVMDSRVRPAHRARNGTTYYLNPEGKQLGIIDMPHPPYESMADGNKIAYGCRCWLTPVLRLQPEEVTAGQFDPDVMAAWFDRATETEQQYAIGATPHNLAKRAFGRKPRWFDFVNDDGSFVSI